MSLRIDLPRFDTPALAEQWADALGVMARVGELDVPCAMSVDARRMLFQVLRAMEALDVLDIGTYCGTSALAFALAVGEHGRVASVDIEDVNAADGHWLRAGRPQSPRALMELAGVADRVEFVTMDARQYLKTTTRQFDFISIDGWHEDFAVEEEVQLALDHLRPGGLIFLDDVQAPGDTPPPGMDRIEGPRIALERMVAAGAPFRVVPVMQTMDGGWAAAAFLVAPC